MMIGMVLVYFVLGLSIFVDYFDAHRDKLAKLLARIRDARYVLGRKIDWVAQAFGSWSFLLEDAFLVESQGIHDG